MKYFWNTVGVLVVMAVVATVAWWPQVRDRIEQSRSAALTYLMNQPVSAAIPDLVVVHSPMPNTLIQSPLTVKGVARGSWFFEAVAPVRLVDRYGVTVAEGQARVQGNWMTTDFVPFEATLTFKKSSAADGILILENDNPSGLPDHAKQLRILVKFR